MRVFGTYVCYQFLEIMVFFSFVEYKYMKRDIFCWESGKRFALDLFLTLF